MQLENHMEEECSAPTQMLNSTSSSGDGNHEAVSATAGTCNPATTIPSVSTYIVQHAFKTTEKHFRRVVKSSAPQTRSTDYEQVLDIRCIESNSPENKARLVEVARAECTIHGNIGDDVGGSTIDCDLCQGVTLSTSQKGLCILRWNFLVPSSDPSLFTEATPGPKLSQRNPSDHTPYSGSQEAGLGMIPAWLSPQLLHHSTSKPHGPTTTSSATDRTNAPLPTNDSDLPPPASSRSRIFALKGSPGLFLMSFALCPEDQLRVAMRGLLTYSESIHTNISNLKKIQAAAKLAATSTPATSCPNNPRLDNSDQTATTASSVPGGPEKEGGRTNQEGRGGVWDVLEPTKIHSSRPSSDNDSNTDNNGTSTNGSDGLTSYDPPSTSQPTNNSSNVTNTAGDHGGDASEESGPDRFLSWCRSFIQCQKAQGKTVQLPITRSQGKACLKKTESTGSEENTQLLEIVAKDGNNCHSTATCMDNNSSLTSPTALTKRTDISQDSKSAATEENQEGPTSIYSITEEEHKKRRRLEELRWSSLGYHYDWTYRSYHESNHSPVPISFSKLMAFLALPLLKSSYISGFKSEAGIINYYPPGTGMGAHIDDAEPAILQPILSLSLGASCVFLIGTADRTEQPTAIYLRSGDALVMDRHARICFHSVPRIIDGSFTPLSSPQSLFDPRCPCLVQSAQSNTAQQALDHTCTCSKQCAKAWDKTTRLGRGEYIPIHTVEYDQDSDKKYMREQVKQTASDPTSSSSSFCCRQFSSMISEDGIAVSRKVVNQAWTNAVETVVLELESEVTNDCHPTKVDRSGVRDLLMWKGEDSSSFENVHLEDYVDAPWARAGRIRDAQRTTPEGEKGENGTDDNTEGKASVDENESKSPVSRSSPNIRYYDDMDIAPEIRAKISQYGLTVEEVMACALEYMKDTRINMNVRQVNHPDFCQPSKKRVFVPPEAANIGVYAAKSMDQFQEISKVSEGRTQCVLQRAFRGFANISASIGNSTQSSSSST